MSFVRSSLICGAVALLAGQLASPRAYAQQGNDEAARRHFTDGVSYYEQGQYDRALSSFRAAYQSSPRPALLYNMAQCQIRLNKRAEAIRLLQQFLSEDPNTSMREQVLRLIENLRRSQGGP